MSEWKLVRLDDYRPHVCLEHSGGVSVFPFLMLEGIAQGRIEIGVLSEDEMRGIVKDWLTTLEDKT